MTNPLNNPPQQRLPSSAYTSPEWLAREQTDLFSKTWAFAGVVSDYENPGDFRTVQAGNNALFVVKGADDEIRAFHNICRHRGTELLEGCGNAGKTIVCPYHNWVYQLDGRLRGIPAQRECFPDIDKKENPLFAAAIGIYKNLVFVHPDETPDEPFETWVDQLDSVPWPHKLGENGLEESPDTILYEMKCNWKVFVENALDGYHLAYLHKETLGGPDHDKNLWQAFGRHMVWWSTEREGVKHRIPQFVETAAKGTGMKTAHGKDEIGYGGVYFLFPTTIITPNPWGFSIATLEPKGPNVTRMRVRNWAPTGWLTYKLRAKDIPGFDPDTGLITSDKWTKHPLDTGDFQTEDVWVCEKMQRALQSPKHSVAALAHGAGGEAALDFFQSSVLEFMGSES